MGLPSLIRLNARRFKREDSPGGRPKTFTYRFKPLDHDYQVTFTFKKPEVDRAELIGALKAMIAELLEEQSRDAEPEAHPGKGRRSFFRRRDEGGENPRP